MIGAKIKKGHMTLTTPLLGMICHCKLGFDTVYRHAKFDDSIFSRSRDIIWASIFELGRVILTKPLLRVICHPDAVT